MKKIIRISPVILICLFACNSNDNKATGDSETDINVISEFIKAALVRDYDKAKTYMIEDSLALQRINNIARVPLSAEEKSGLASASINMHTVTRLDDSTTVVIYSNSFKNNKDTLRALRQDGKWLVDFNYLFDHDADSLTKPSPKQP